MHHLSVNTAGLTYDLISSFNVWVQFELWYRNSRELFLCFVRWLSKKILKFMQNSQDILKKVFTLIRVFLTYSVKWWAMFILNLTLSPYFGCIFQLIEISNMLDLILALSCPLSVRIRVEIMYLLFVGQRVCALVLCDFH